ncbi:hypothetical protein LCGC14_0592000 [marine sediment metagenome]|uniref:Uncharacterized protein n=1 Tax=marine sediment metagenome TaxID=412755 RepID=A0A0F9RI82_9ZZZZ|nr:hypothetical protein [Candidatus Aminicenantes bacterium]
MKQRIKPNFTEKEIDSFLKENYGYGIWEFESSLLHVYTWHISKKEEKVFQFIEKRIKQLENLKRKIIELLDDYSSEIDLYGLYNSLRPAKIIKWTPSERKKFIIKYFKLSSFNSVINKQFKRYQEHTSYMKEDALEPAQFRMYLKLINLVILIWSYFMRRGSKVDWINMEILLNWFSKKLDKIGVLDIFKWEKESAPSPDILRLIRNKYKKTKYYVLAKNIFNNLKESPEREKEEFSRPLDQLDEFIKWEDKSLNHIYKISDVMTLGFWILGE